MLKATTPGLGSARSDELPEIGRLRELSRDAARNQPLAVAALDSLVSKVIGRGISPQSQPDAEFLGLTPEQSTQFQRQAERLWRLWATDMARRCDAQRRLGWDALASLALRSQKENGDSFVQWVRRPRSSWPFTLQAQLIEADLVCNPNDAHDGNPPPSGYPQGHEVWSGVEMTASGMPVAYWVRQSHPGEWYGRVVSEWVRVPATNIMGEPVISHLADLKRIGSCRGVPWLAPVIEILKTLSEYSESEATAALVSSFFTVFVESQAGGGLAELVEADGTSNESAEGELQLGPGLINDLAPGEKISSAKMDRPNSGYGAFVQAQLRLIGAALGIPMEVLTKHFESSYSAARGALLEAWEMFMQRRAEVIDCLYRPAWEMLMTEAAATGLLEVSEDFWTDPMTRAAYLECTWTGPAPGQIDETKAIAAAEARVRLGVSTRSIEAQRLGYDYEKNVLALAQEKRLRQENGLDEVELQPAPPDMVPQE